MKKSIVITGIFGFIGSNLATHLYHEKLNNIIGIDKVIHDLVPYHELYSFENLSKIKWDKVDIIIHLAGLSHDTKARSLEKDYYDINVGLTQKIFAKYLESSAKKFIFFSSVKAVADSVVEDILIEDITPNPMTPYGRSKIECEKLILQGLDEWKFKFKKDETYKKVYILRPCMIHGKGNKGNLNLLFNFVQKGIPYPLGKFDNLRSFTSIENLIYIVDNIVERTDIASGVYNVADDEPISTIDLIKLIANSLSKKDRIMNLNKHFVELLANIGDVLHLPINSETLQKLTESYVVSNKKIKQTLGINKLPISSRDGLKKTLKSLNLKSQSN